MRYLQPVPEQMQDISFLPSMISYNARALNTSSTDIMERISWLNSQQSAYSNTYNIVKEFSKFSSENKTQTVSVQDAYLIYVSYIADYISYTFKC